MKNKNAPRPVSAREGKTQQETLRGAGSEGSAKADSGQTHLNIF